MDRDTGGHITKLSRWRRNMVISINTMPIVGAHDYSIIGEHI